jgi:hypothetical protein
MKHRIILIASTFLLICTLVWMLGGIRDGRAEENIRVAGLGEIGQLLIRGTGGAGGGSSGGDGPNAWYINADPSAGTDTWPGNTTSNYAIITVAVAGSATKVKWHTHSAGITCKMALYSSNLATLLGSGTGTTVADGWMEVTLGTPVAVTAQNYVAAVSCAVEAIARKLDVGTTYWNTDAYANFPVTPLSTGLESGEAMGFGIYVD